MLEVMSASPLQLTLCIKDLASCMVCALGNTLLARLLGKERGVPYLNTDVVEVWDLLLEGRVFLFFQEVGSAMDVLKSGTLDEVSLFNFILLANFNLIKIVRLMDIFAL